ncbi:MAG: MBOAT family protein [Muribaculaceae bacterium]|nr:MBOAT family protein [Muribaculaceae bacterium]
MLFNSFIYLRFLVVVFILYWLVFGKMRHARMSQNLFLVLASYIFYGWWNWKFLGLIAFTTACSYVSGLMIERSRHKSLILWTNVVIYIGILFIYKYYGFFVENLNLLLQSTGIHLDFVTLDLILPLGISFYTFQALSYLIDVYRGDLPATRDAAAFWAYISFFPQLVAGPIERATNLLPQFQRERTFDYSTGVDGMRQILWGLFKKMVIADNCALVVNNTFQYFHDQTALSLWVGAILFAFQIYGDFSGYSDMAIGTAKLFGIKLMTNFRYPYFSRSISEVWRRWHISLTSWFRDYVYIPLGGNRHGKAKTTRNVISVYLISGLWHGANWTFIVWGLYNAMFFIPVIISGRKKKYDTIVAHGRRLPSLRDAMMILVTFTLFTIGWTIFRSANISDALQYISMMFVNPNTSTEFVGTYSLTWIGIMLIIEWLGREHDCPLFFDNSSPKILHYRTVRWIIYLVLFTACLIASGTQDEFIYFQF